MHANQNNYKQMSIFNELNEYSDREINWLIHSWAFVFRVFIYPLITPSMFDCLYSTKDSRPANPPQVVVSLLIIQAMFNKTDDEMHDWMMSGALDIRFATNTLGIPSEKLPTSDKQLTRFRERNRSWAEEHEGNCPLDDCLKQVSYGMAAMMGLDLKNVRIDSTMVSANMARMSRHCILYTQNRAMILQMKKERGDEFVSELGSLNLAHYLDAFDINVSLYHSKSSSEYKLALLAEECEKIRNLCSESDLKTRNGELFLRILSEQTVLEDGVRRPARSEDGTMTSSCVQNPADSDATFRKKAGKEFIGYIVNLAESVGPFGSLVLSWDFEQNIANDAVMAYAFLREADQILAGINDWQQKMGLSRDDDMARCQELVRKKMDMTVKAITDARKKGLKIPRSITEELTPDSDSENMSGEAVNGQLSMEEVFSFFDLTFTEEKTEDSTEDSEEEKITDEQSTPAPENKGEASPVTTEQSDTKSTTEKNDSSTGSDTKPWTILGKPGAEGIKLPEFADLEDDFRRESILTYIREMNPWTLASNGNVNMAVADGAYSTESLINAAGDNGFLLAPTDLLGRSVNPIIGLYEISEDRSTIISCPMGNTILDQKKYKAGIIRLKMDAEKCKTCPFRNDCKCDFQKRSPVAVVNVSPNAKGRILTEANMGSEEYKALGRFRNGVETIPSMLHNILNIDSLPIGKELKAACMNLKITALNTRKFILFAFNRSRIAANPILSRA